MYVQQCILPAFISMGLLFGETIHRVERFFFCKRKLLDSCVMLTNRHPAGIFSEYWAYSLYPAFIFVKWCVGLNTIGVNYRVRHKSVNTPLSHERLVVCTWLSVYSGWG
jgi:hypothetical protein